MIFEIYINKKIEYQFKQKNIKIVITLFYKCINKINNILIHISFTRTHTYITSPIVLPYTFLI